MGKTFYGISMGYKSVDNQTKRTSDKHLFEYLMKQIIQEFLKVEARMIRQIPVDPNKNKKFNDLLMKDRCVFSFDGEEYFSDIVKTADLIIDDLMRLLIQNSSLMNNSIDDKNVKEYFRNYFEAYCTEMEFEVGADEEQIVTEIFEKLDELEDKGRNVSREDQLKIDDLLSSGFIPNTIHALA